MQANYTLLKNISEKLSKAEASDFYTSLFVIKIVLKELN